MPNAPFVESVCHPSDFSEASRVAFDHALALVLFRQASLTVLHVAGADRAVATGSHAPRVRETLERWGLLEEGSARGDVYDRLAIKVAKISIRSADPLQAIVRQLEERPADLVVLATEARTGLPAWIKPSVAERVAQRSGAMTLFVPHGCRGFVAPDDGRIALRRILIPVDHAPRPGAAVAYAARVAVASHEDSVELMLLHVGDDSDRPELELPELQSCSWSRIDRSGGVVDEIVAAADDRSADLIVMATEGRRGIVDALRGSVTQQVLRRAPCPLLAVPAGLR